MKKREHTGSEVKINVFSSSSDEANRTYLPDIPCIKYSVSLTREDSSMCGVPLDMLAFCFNIEDNCLHLFVHETLVDAQR